MNHQFIIDYFSAKYPLGDKGGIRKAQNRVGIKLKLNIMLQENLIYDDVIARLDVSEEVADWCDRCSEGHPIY